MTSHHAIEVTKTVLEVADVAWTAVETYHHHHHHHHDDNEEENHESTNSILDPRDRELEALREENRRLRSLLEANLKLFETLAESAALSHDCPSDLYARLVSMVTSKEFLARLENLRQALSKGTQSQFPFKEPTDDVQTVEVLIEMDHQEPSWWVLVNDDMIPSNVEEQSAIDNEHYIVVNEEHVVDAVAHFLAKCIMSNPKAKILKPEELQKLLVQEVTALSKVGRVVDIWHAGKMFYTLSTWGLAFGGLYQARGALKLAAKGVHATSKFSRNSILGQLSRKEGWRSTSRRWTSGDSSRALNGGSYSSMEGVYGVGDTAARSKRVMVVVDETSRSKHAMIWALNSLTNKGDLMTLLHVVSPHDEASSSLAQSLRSLCKSCKPEVDVEALVIQGPKLATVLNQVKKLEVSVLVLGQKKSAPLIYCFCGPSRSEDLVTQCINDADCFTIGVRKQSKGVSGCLINTRWQKNFWLLA